MVKSPIRDIREIRGSLHCPLKILSSPHGSAAVEGGAAVRIFLHA
jgi:hypothetical protein